jgi:hypothetical protein
VLRRPVLEIVEFYLFRQLGGGRAGGTWKARPPQHLYDVLPLVTHDDLLVAGSAVRPRKSYGPTRARAAEKS